MIPRVIQQNVIKSLDTLKKLILILGPRQSGKTTLLTALRSHYQSQQMNIRYLNCDLAEDLSLLDTQSLTLLQKLTTNTHLLLIDEAQRLTNPGLTLKILHDNFPGLKLIVTGSSSFELKNQLSDPLTGRYLDFTLFPLSWQEIVNYQKPPDAVYLVADQLLYGSYPEIYLENSVQAKQVLLSKITESYLFKDILSFSKIRNSQAIQNLVRALAYQIGSEVNENELSNRIKIDRKTLLSYLEILEKSFVIYRLHPHSANPRREIGRRYKVYFIDLGIRNSLINDFNSLDIRNDVGALWENFLIVERLKLLKNSGQNFHARFWRNYNGAEVDYLEITGPKIQAWEIKYGSKATLSRGVKTFNTDYQSQTGLLNPDNFQDFLTFPLDNP